MTCHRALTLVIADDHCRIRTALKNLLRRRGFQVVGEAADGREAVRLCRDLRPDLVVLDLGMAGLNGIDAAREIRETHPDARVVLLTMQAVDVYVLESLRAGVMGYVVKSQVVPCLLEAIEAVCRGEVYTSPGIEDLTGDAANVAFQCAGPLKPTRPRVWEHDGVGANLDPCLESSS